MRLKTDLQFEMMFIYFTLQSPRNYSATVMKEAPVVGYYGLGNKYKENALTLQNCRKAMKKFNCINDNLKHDGSIGMFYYRSAINDSLSSSWRIKISKDHRHN